MKRRRYRGLLTASILLAPLTACGQGQFANPFIVPLVLKATPNPLSLSVGKSARVAVTATGDDAPVTNLNVKVLEAPRELTVTASGSSLQIQAAQSTPPGAYPVTIQGSTRGGHGESVIQVDVTAETTPSRPGFSASFKPTDLTLAAGDSARVALQITREANYTGQPTITQIKPLSKQLTVTLDGDGILVKASNDVTPGTYVVTAVVSDGTLTHEVSLNVTVNAATAN